MSVEFLTYGALGARLNISPVAARSLARRLHLPRSLSEDGKALVSVDLSEIHHTPHPAGRRQAGDAAQWAAKVAALEATIVQLEAVAAGHRADFEHERERADRLMSDLLQATSEATAARETAVVVFPDPPLLLKTAMTTTMVPAFYPQLRTDGTLRILAARTR